MRLSRVPVLLLLLMVSASLLTTAQASVPAESRLSENGRWAEWRGEVAADLMQEHGPDSCFDTSGFPNVGDRPNCDIHLLHVDVDPSKSVEYQGTLDVSIISAKINPALAIYERQADGSRGALVGSRPGEIPLNWTRLTITDASGSYYVVVNGRGATTQRYDGTAYLTFVKRPTSHTPPPLPTPSDVNETKAFTVIAVVDWGFNPYHFDFLGHKHPWNTDADTETQFDAYADPSTYIEGHPGAQPIQIQIPTDANADVQSLKNGDLAEWNKFAVSQSGEEPKLYWFPGTKVIGAFDYDPWVTDALYPPRSYFFGGNSSHGTRSAASAAGNIHGTCQECLFVLINGGDPANLAWAAAQPWIDVITNSYGHNTSLVLRDGIYFDGPFEATRQASERGQFTVFSAGNGLANAFDVPQLTYTTSEQGPDWTITVGAIDPKSGDGFSGSGKPADISSIGISYPSTGGASVNGTGTHSGTSNAGPVTAGTLAKVIQSGRELLGDFTSGNSNGVVSSGGSFVCGTADPSCMISDGVLTRHEVQETVFKTVLPPPSGLRVGGSLSPTWPSTKYNYYYIGHGVINGHMRGPQSFVAEQKAFIDRLRGDRAAVERPSGEENWFIIDSKCRQRLWGAWSGGYYKGADPTLSPVDDPIATTFNGWCSSTPDNLLREIAHAG